MCEAELVLGLFIVFGGDLRRIIPLELAGGAISEIGGLPVGAIARVEYASVGLELVGFAVEHNLHLGRIGCLAVDELLHLESVIVLARQAQKICSMHPQSRSRSSPSSGSLWSISGSYVYGTKPRTSP